MKTFSSKEVIERLKIALNLSSDNALAETLGVSKATLSNWKSRNSIDIPLLFSKCEHVSVDWLLTGNGAMLKPTTQEPQVKVKPIHQPRYTEKKEDTQVVYLYDFKATAGLKALFDNNKQNIIDTIKIPNLPKCDGAIHIMGDSMYPELKSGDIILYKQQLLDINNLLYGEMYILSYNIDGEDYIVVKYIRKSDKGEPFISLGSENPAYAARDIDFRCITALALVKASVRINCMM
ncbi:MAG: helix-turn-helix domain-containing protein [Prevotella sp.]|nr:helix-turn-helix domain-containing protein [Prevotella sp.]